MARKACSITPTGCARCRYARRPQGGSDCLLLSPHNGNAQEAAARILRAEDIPFQQSGRLLILPTAGAPADLLACLARCLPASVQHSVQATLYRGSLERAARAAAAFVRAEPLSRMLARLEHEWVREALDQDWLFSLFHPIVDVATGEPYAYEALIRARQPGTQEVIGSGTIIHACEQLALEHVLDQRARQSAIRGAAALDLPHGRFFINFLPNTIYDPEICLRTTMETAAECGVDLSRLVFEVVETENIPDLGRLQRILDYYRAQGVGTAVDDMGAGFATLEYLTVLRPDYVKLDRDMVVRAEQDGAVREKMESVVARARDLHIRVIAEGIETPAQRDLCLDCGVDLLQGFLFARPANPPECVRVGALGQRLAA